MSEIKLNVAVSQDCKIVPEAPTVWMATLSMFRGERLVVTLERPKRARSLRANRYWWGMVVPTFQQVWSIAREQSNLPPYNRDEVHEVLVQVLVGFEDGPLPGSRVRKRTSEMTSEQFAKLIDAAREMAEKQYGMILPNQGESGWQDLVG